MKDLTYEEGCAPPIPRTAENKEVWTAEEVAEYLRCTPRHVTNLATRKQLPAIKLGSVWRFRRQDILAFR